MFKRVYIVLLFLTSFTVSAQNWLTDIEAAKTLANEQNQKILLVFSGSDWCAPCIKLDREIWRSKEFKEFSKSNFILLRADFPRRKNNALSLEQQEHNKKLAARYNKNGHFPLVVILDANGNVLGETGYRKMKPKQYIELLKSF